MNRILLFSDYLRELMQKKHMTVSALARLCGIERTALSRTLTGQRVLPYHVLNEMTLHLKLTLEEEKRLRAYYDAQFEKEGTRVSREMIGNLFSDLASLDLHAPAFEETRLLLSFDQYVGERCIFSGETNVQYLFRMVISEEIMHADARLDMTLPPEGLLNRELLRRYLNEERAVEVNHIICFDASDSDDDINLNNLECFCQLLPVCLLSKKQYHLYYYYDSNVASRQTNPFPYFLVTHSCVVCLSEDGTCAMLLRASEQIAYYQRHFRNLEEQCHSLIQYTGDPLEILSSYQKCTDPDGFYMLMDQPCFARFYTDELVAAHLRKSPGFEQIFQAALERFSLLRKVSRFYTIFSEAGFQRFLATGTLDDYPEELVTPFSPEERTGLALKLSAAIRSEHVTGRIVQEGVFPEYLALCTTEANGFGLFTTEQFPLIDGLCSIWIRESGLCRAFHGWLSWLPQSSLTLSVKATADRMEYFVKNGAVREGME